MATALVGRDRELEFLTARTRGGRSRRRAVRRGRRRPGDGEDPAPAGAGRARLGPGLRRPPRPRRRVRARDAVRALRRRARQLPRGGPGVGLRRTFDQEQIDELASAFPAMRPLASGDSPAPAPEDRVRVYGATRELLGRAGAGQDRPHHPRRPALERPRLARADRPPAAPAAAREGDARLQLPDAAARLLGDGARSAPPPTRAASACNDSAPLQPKDAGALLDGNPRTEEILEQSGGNPFYILELSRAEPIAGPVGAGRRSDGVPEAIRIAIDRELGALSADGRALANASAVVGDPFSLDLSIGAAGLEPDAGLTALDELAASDLVRSTDVPRRFQFRHPLVRSAVYEAVPAGNAAGDPLALRRAPPRRPRGPLGARPPRRAVGAVRRPRGGGAAPRRGPRLGRTGPGQRGALAAGGAAPAARGRPDRAAPGTAAAHSRACSPR